MLLVNAPPFPRFPPAEPLLFSARLMLSFKSREVVAEKKSKGVKEVVVFDTWGEVCVRSARIFNQVGGYNV